MIASTMLLLASMTVGDYQVRCSAQDNGQAAVWTYAPNGDPPTAVRFKYGAAAGFSLPMAANTTWPLGPDVDASSSAAYAVVWTANDQTNNRRVYLCVRGGTPMLVGQFGAVDESWGAIARVGIYGNRIYVAWMDGFPTTWGFKAAQGTRICVQAFNANFAAQTAAAAGPPKRVDTYSRRSLLNFGDIATDNMGGCAVTFVRATGGEASLTRGVCVSRYLTPSASPTGDIGVVFAERILTGTANHNRIDYTFSEIACYSMGTSVVAYCLDTDLYQEHLSPSGASYGVAYLSGGANVGGVGGVGTITMFFVACDQRDPPNLNGDYVVTWCTPTSPPPSIPLHGAQNIVFRRRINGVTGPVTWLTSASHPYVDDTNTGPCVGSPYAGAPLRWQFGDQGPGPHSDDVILFGILP